MIWSQSIRRGVTLLLAGVLVFSLAPGINLASAADEIYIHLQYASFDPLSEEPQVLAGGRLAITPGNPATYLLQFTGPVLDEWKEGVREAGVQLYGYLPDYAFIARAAPEALEKARGLPYVRWIGAYHPAYRLDAALLAAPAGEESASLVVQALPDVDLEVLTAQVEGLGGVVEDRVSNEISAYLRVDLPAGQALALAGLDGVLWVEPFLPRELLNATGGGAIMHANDVRAKPLSLFGKGQIVAVADTGLDVGTTGAAMSDDFEGRIVEGKSLCSWPYRTTWNDFFSHGTHVAGSVLGSGRLSGSQPASHQYGSSFAGVAPEARLVFQAIDDPWSGNLECIPNDFVGGLFGPAYAKGARIHTNSWGGSTGSGGQYGGYTIESQKADLAAWTYRDLLILFAAGNSGTDANADGKVDADSIASPGTAKNVVTVGASESERTEPETAYAWGDFWPGDYPIDPIYSDLISDNRNGMAAFSSRGPTDDGRVKPDVVAPGTFIISARSHDPDANEGWDEYNADYLYMGGTSMATPLTAGASALVREWLVRIRGFTDPSSALMKAVLINGTAAMGRGQYTSPREIPALRPNTVSGWGRVDLKASLPADSAASWLEDNTSGLRTAGSANYSLTIGSAKPGATPAGGPLRITLAWTDYPGNPGAAKALVNDLDLELIDPNGKHYYGNAGLYSSGHRCLRAGKWDQCNNVEGILIPTAPNGPYTVLVHAANVPQGPQPFAVVASGVFVGGDLSYEGSVYLPVVVGQSTMRR